MRTAILGSLLLGLSGCGGVSPELYRLVVDFFTLPDNCYSNNAQPSATTTTTSPTVVQVQVWDGADQTAILSIEGGARSIDMGDAPNITLGGVMKGKKGTGGWIFSAETVTKATTVGQTVTNTGKVDLTFDRTPTSKGTLVLSSNRACAGSTCMGTQPSCTVSNVAVAGTRIATDYERAP